MLVYLPGGSQAKEEDEVLQIPEQDDVKKTVAISEEELRREMAEPAPGPLPARSAGCCRSGGAADC